ncbi:hypothetical protein HanPI659440_Chr10g0386301 [Helianthus annuus]|nr:hypothetical protein HanPI659440_Chr10g0386301 [Helianthus annuus]
MTHPSTQTYYNHVPTVCPSQTRRMVDLVKLTGLTKDIVLYQTNYRQSTDTSAPTVLQFQISNVRRSVEITDIHQAQKENLCFP